MLTISIDNFFRFLLNYCTIFNNFFTPTFLLYYPVSIVLNERVNEGLRDALLVQVIDIFSRGVDIIKWF